MLCCVVVVVVVVVVSSLWTPTCVGLHYPVLDAVH